MMHSDVKMPKSSSGICNILIAVLVFLIFLFAPLAQTVVNGEVLESFTVAENIDKGSGGFYLFLISLMIVPVLVLGILKLKLPKVFQHFVVSVVDFYYSFGFCIGLVLMAFALGSQNAETSYWGHEVRQEMGIGPILLVLCSLPYFVTALRYFCSFYKWYPLQTLFWGLHPVLNILVTLLLSSVAVKLIPDSAGDVVLKTVGVIISWGVLFVEIWLLVTYRKEWNRRLRARMKHNPENAERDLSASPMSIEEQQYSTQDVSPSAVNASNDMPQSVTPPVQKTVEVPASSGSHKKYYIIGGASVLVVLSVLFFCLKGGETVEVINVPAIKETLYEGRVGKSEVQMCLKQEGDSLYGTYFYKRNKQDIQLSGKIEEGRYVINEFVEGKNTGTFQMDLWEYDGNYSFTGTWSNRKKSLDINLENKMHRIIPSTDPRHPFVGEWRHEINGQAPFAMLGLYNKDIDGVYGLLMVEDGRLQRVDSVLQLKENKAVVRLKEDYDGVVHEYTLTYNSSDRSLEIKMENGVLLWIPLDDRSLEQCMADVESQNRNTEESEYNSQAEVYEEDILPPPEAPEQLIIVEDDTVSVEETNECEEAERARLQAELATELHKEAEDPNKIYDNAEVMPEYPGGYAAMMRYLAQNVKYPQTAQENGTQGKVVVQFVVDTDGSIINAHVLTSVDFYLDKEALRVIKSMPRWTPGKLNGKPVRVRYTVPVNFRLS